MLAGSLAPISCWRAACSASGQTIRINCYLVDSKTHRQIAAETIEVNGTDAFNLQDQVVNAALDMLPARIRSTQRKALAVRQDTQPTAYEAYIRGRGYLQEYEKPENIDNAIAEFNQAIKIDPKYAPAYAGLGEAYLIGVQQLDKGKEWVAKASSSCQKALSLSANSAEGHVCLGNVLKVTGQYDKAAAEFQRATDLDPDNDKALTGLADAYQKLGNPAAAEDTYKKAINLRPNYWGVYSRLGAFYYTQAHYAKAADMFSKVTQLAPDNYRGYSNLAAMYLAQGRYEEAIAACQHSIELRPNRDAYANLGAAYFWLHRYPDAVATYKQSLQLDQHDAMTWGNLADALYWMPGQRTEATAAYRNASLLSRSQLEVNPRDATTMAYLAEYSAKLDDSKEALNNIRLALTLAPDDPDVMVRAALVYYHLGDRNTALAWLRKAVEAGESRQNIRDTPDFSGLGDDADFRSLIGLN